MTGVCTNSVSTQCYLGATLSAQRSAPSSSCTHNLTGLSDPRRHCFPFQPTLIHCLLPPPTRSQRSIPSASNHFLAFGTILYPYRRIQINELMQESSNLPVQNTFLATHGISNSTLDNLCTNHTTRISNTSVLSSQRLYLSLKTLPNSILSSETKSPTFP